MERKTLEFLRDAYLTNTENLANTDAHAVIIPDSMRIESLERFMDTPNRFRGKYETTSIADFISYCTEHSTADSRIYIEQIGMYAVAIFDHGSPDKPRWGDHWAKLSLEQTPTFEALTKNNETDFKQQQLTDFLQDWEEYISFHAADGSVIEFNPAISRILNLKFSKNQQLTSSEGNFNREMSAMEKIELSALNDNMPPAYFYLDTPPYEGFQARPFKCQLRMRTQDDSATRMKYRIQSLPAIRQEIANEFRDRIKTSTEHAKVKLGTIELG